ncbi:mannose-6-phosphate isomerase, partial [Niallia nealsonii AAU1]
ALDGKANREQEQSFLLCSVIEGDGSLEKDGKEFAFQKGDHFLLPNKFGAFELNGKAELIVSYI